MRALHGQNDAGKKSDKEHNTMDLAPIKTICSKIGSRFRVYFSEPENDP